MTKKWYIRKENTSKYIKEPYIYYVGSGDCWTASVDKAKRFKTKKEATALSLEIDGEVYGK